MSMRQKTDTGKGGRSKQLALDEAVRRYVRPGMKLHFAGGIGGPSAAICEIIRQYRGTTPGFTIIGSTITGHGLNLVHCGLATRLVCAVCADISATGRPSKIIQAAVREKRIVLENWSLLSLQQRFMAGAFGVPFMATKSVLGSTIASDNDASFKEIDDPFGSAERVGIVKALVPDISMVHGCVGDEEGNIILNAPYGEDLWGPYASAGGILVTVEKIVPAAYVKQYAALVKIPAYMVKAVSLAPLGLHPFSLPNPGIHDFEPYEKDVAFLNGLHEASKSKETLDAWIEEWVMGCATHRHYLDRLGPERVAALKDEAKARTDVPPPEPSKAGRRPSYDREEMMLVALAREIRGSVRASGHRVILSGAGNRGVAAFVAYHQLKAEGCEVELITGNGQMGFTPLPGMSIQSTEAGVRSCKMLTDTVTAQGLFVGGRHNRCLSVLGAGQVDRQGNINSTVTSKGEFLVGSGGANDAMNAREVIIALDHAKDRLVEELPYVTGKGDAVTTVVSSAGILKRPRKGEELLLVACFPDEGAASLEEKIRSARERCGWPLKTAATVEEVRAPDQGELDLLRWLVSTP